MVLVCFSPSFSIHVVCSILFMLYLAPIRSTVLHVLCGILFAIVGLVHCQTGFCLVALADHFRNPVIQWFFSACPNAQIGDRRKSFELVECQ